MIEYFSKFGLEGIDLRGPRSFSNYGLLTEEERVLFEFAYAVATESLVVFSNYAEFRWRRFLERLACNLTTGGIGAIYMGVAMAIAGGPVGLAVGLVTNAVLSSVICNF